MNELAVFDPIVKTLAKYKEENEKLVFAYADPQGNRDARSLIYKIRQVKAKIALVHKDAKSDALEFCRQLDAKKRELLGQVDEMIAVHNEPLLLIEKEKADAEAERLRKIKEAEEKAERERTEELERREAEVRAREEKVAAEEAAKGAKQKAREAEQRQIERDKQIAEEAKAKAEADAKAALEEAERRRIAEAEEAEMRRRADIQAAEDRAAAEAREKELAERQRQEQIVADAFEREQKERKRQANKKHQQEVHAGIRQRLFEIGLEKKQVEFVLDALIAGTIPHVKIEY